MRISVRMLCYSGGAEKCIPSRSICIRDGADFPLLSKLDFVPVPPVKQQLPLKLYECGCPLVIRGVEAICTEPDCASAIVDVRERS